MRTTSRWSSRLRGRQELRVRTRKEPWPPCVVGGAAQLYVMYAKDGLIHRSANGRRYPSGLKDLLQSLCGFSQSK